MDLNVNPAKPPAALPKIPWNKIIVGVGVAALLAYLAATQNTTTPGTTPTDPPTRTPAVFPVANLSTTAEGVAMHYAQAVVALDDRPTSARLAQEWTTAIQSISQAPSLADAGKVSSKAFERAMATRKGPSRAVDWLGKVRRPLDTDIDFLIQDGEIKSPGDLGLFFQALAHKIRDD